MLRTAWRLGYPERLIADGAYGSAPMPDWLVEGRGIAPHIPVFDKSQRTDGTFWLDTLPSQSKLQLSMRFFQQDLP